MPQKYVKPGAGPDGAPLFSRHPVTKLPIPPEGAWVDEDAVMRRRLRDGDWVAGEPPAPVETAEQPSVAEDFEPVSTDEVVR